MPTAVYEVRVSNGPLTAPLSVECENLGPEWRRGSFAVISSSFDDRRYDVLPSHRQATFREQLRGESKASDRWLSVGDDIAWITAKCREAYGPQVNVEVKLLPLAERQS